MSHSSQNPLTRDLDDILARTEHLWEELRGERLLITGATGFFGCWLLESFAWANRRLNLGAKAVGVARHAHALAKKAPHLAQEEAIAMHAADVRNGVFPDGQFSHCIHAATEASARLNLEAPQAMFDTSVEGTRRTLQFSRESGVKRFLLVSSGAVYGNQPTHIAHLGESFDGGPDPMTATSAYAEGKRAAEMLASLAASAPDSKAAYKFETTVARCFAFVGPYMQLAAHFAIGNFIEDRLHDKIIAVAGDGTAVRSYLYASDLAVWLWTILFKGQSQRAYNVGSERAITIADLARASTGSLRPDDRIRIALKPMPGSPVHRYVPNTERARKELGLAETVKLDEAIGRSLTWFSQSRSDFGAKTLAGAANAMDAQS